MTLGEFRRLTRLMSDDAPLILCMEEIEYGETEIYEVITDGEDGVLLRLDPNSVVNKAMSAYAFRMNRLD